MSNIIIITVNEFGLINRREIDPAQTFEQLHLLPATSDRIFLRPD